MYWFQRWCRSVWSWFPMGWGYVTREEFRTQWNFYWETSKRNLPVNYFYIIFFLILDVSLTVFWNRLVLDNDLFYISLILLVILVIFYWTCSTDQNEFPWFEKQQKYSKNTLKAILSQQDEWNWNHFRCLKKVRDIFFRSKCFLQFKFSYFTLLQTHKRQALS